MHANDFFGALGKRRQLGNRDRRSVRGEDDLGTQERIEMAKECSLDLEFFADRFDGKVAIFESCAVSECLDSGECSIAVGGSQPVPGNLAVEILGNCGESAIQELLLNIAEQHAVSGAGK